MRRFVCAAAVLMAAVFQTPALGDPITQQGDQPPAAYFQRRRTNPNAFAFRRAFIAQTQRVRQTRVALMSGDPEPAEVIAAASVIAVQGDRSIPVLPVKFRNTASDPFPIADLQARLFGPDADSMRSFYLQNSYQLLRVGGTVRDWRVLANDDTHYEGADFKDANGVLQPCHGMCNSSKIAEAIKAALDGSDMAVNFGQFDNDGPDGQPNSGDDDGYVDFAAFVQPETGGECGKTGGKNIWSHRSSYSAWTGTEYTTNDKSSAGGMVKIDDYVVIPALNCDGKTMIHIGVFAHEFGHAFGLPDLYDTDPENGVSQGIGHWCLMASGSWGGDGQSPERPSHMSAWAKAYLGWLQPQPITADRKDLRLSPVQSGRTAALKVPISPTQYYLLEYRTRQGFDAGLPTAGLLVWKVNDTAVTSGLRTNRVNADAQNKGVGLIEADNTGGLDRALNNKGNRGNDGDPYPGRTANVKLDANTRPRSQGRIAFCAVSEGEGSVTLTVLTSTNTCS
jgi:M6 family metalloprotease-like protein